MGRWSPAIPWRCCGAEESGGAWRVVLRTPGRLDLELLTCDAGEVMQRLTAQPSDPELERHLAGRSASDE